MSYNEWTKFKSKDAANAIIEVLPIPLIKEKLATVNLGGDFNCLAFPQAIIHRFLKLSAPTVFS